MNHRSALGRVRGLGSSQSGAQAWLVQKISSVILAVLFLWFAFSFAFLIKADYHVVVRWMAAPFNAVLLLTFVVVGIYHGMVGLQVIIEDYVSKTGRRIALIYAMKTVLVMLGLGIVLAILNVAINGDMLLMKTIMWG